MLVKYLFAKNIKNYVLLFLLFSAITSCHNKPPLFTLRSSASTNIGFINKIADDDSLNILDYLYYYNGGGVAIGDINNDGLPDIYFTSNRGSNKLYLNKGHFNFKDITSAAGVQGKGDWKTGVTLADVNGDGLLDMYVSEVGGYKNLQGRNELFINNGNLTFTEKAHEYGLDVEGFNTQASFFDYDNDGDLDMFLVNHSVHSAESYGTAAERMVHNEQSGDKLFRNDSQGLQIHFTEVTAAAGIYSSALGYGLNVMTADMNNDGWQDIYVSNDFHENDYYYINNKNGTFSEINATAFGHESRFSMGSDIADINNDGWNDIITLDMLSPDEKINKSSGGDDPLDIYNFKMAQGYHHQYSKNCLQLNVGGGYRFSDIGLYAGIAATDWSWSPLAADFNNDGSKDLFISNGIMRRPNNLDYLKFISGGFAAQKGQHDKEAINKMPEGKVSNYVFEGTDSLRFINQTKRWGFDKPSLSNGAAYADLDNDGDIDIVVNNINEKAFVYENKSDAINPQHYIEFTLKGKGENTFAFGAVVFIKCKGKLQSAIVTATHGFESASAGAIHFGTGDNTIIDSVEITWPGGQTQVLTNVKTNQRMVIKQADSTSKKSNLLPTNTEAEKEQLFTIITDTNYINFKHKENDFIDFNTQAFIPHEISAQGPKVAVADVNGDALDDFFICGAAGQSGKLFIQQKDEKFKSVDEALFKSDAFCEDVNAVFFDANNDGYPDLYVVSGGNETEKKTPLLLDRLYINNGKGNFKKSNGLPPMYGNKSVAAAADFDHDGDLDLFVGGRVVAGDYGAVPMSYLLLNNGKGKFTIANENLAKGLAGAGMVTGAVWTDIDNDGWKDLVIVGEWMPVTVYKNYKGILQNNTTKYHLQNTAGLWTNIQAADLDSDGYEDMLAGNWGLNSKLHASENYPLKLYVGDIDGNGSADQLLAIEKEQKYYPFLGKEELEKQLPAIIKKRFLTYGEMAGLTIDEIFGDKLKQMNVLSANMLSSCIIQNKKGVLTTVALPFAAQWSPVFTFCTGDFNGDNKTDIITGGNFYGVLPYEGRYDAASVNVLIHTKNTFTPLSSLQHGLPLNGEVRDIQKLRAAHHQYLYLFARNNDVCVAAHINDSAANSTRK